jgi:hypothetical protein
LILLRVAAAYFVALRFSVGDEFPTEDDVVVRCRGSGGGGGGSEILAEELEEVVVGGQALFFFCVVIPVGCCVVAVDGKITKRERFLCLIRIVQVLHETIAGEGEGNGICIVNLHFLLVW